MAWWKKSKPEPEPEIEVTPSSLPKFLTDAATSYLPAFHASLNKKLDEWLREKKIQPDQRWDGKPLLHSALWNGWDQVAEILLQHGADPYAPLRDLTPGGKRTDEHHRSIVTNLAERNATGFLSLLKISSKLGRPIDVNRPDYGGRPPLLFAVSGGQNTSDIELFGRWGADPNIKTFGGDYIIEMAMRKTLDGQNDFSALLGCGANLGLIHEDSGQTIAQKIDTAPALAACKTILRNIREHWRPAPSRFALYDTLSMLERREDGDSVVPSLLLKGIAAGMAAKIFDPARWSNPYEDIPRVIAAMPPHCQRHPDVQLALAALDRQQLGENSPLREWARRVKEAGKPAQIT